MENASVESFVITDFLVITVNLQLILAVSI